MISLSSLPEELLDVILCFTLSLPSSSFLEWMDEDTYSCTPASPTRTVLLVDKTWARIGKPHLYEGVIIRGREQADALAETLNANTKAHAGVNITLAKCIRRLRIDGVQTSAVKDIL
ncbi:hypothetical protein TRAPUB_9620 [Trametes pubescens]|uniref:Uncharacterized protein n=1 Tax=Trametes pubescens TaxID=154538 RepID=A0A1M2W250_TRAPU|nr:hypothetical protein TRAPUB_9620 [Trametes pubescens]